MVMRLCDKNVRVCEALSASRETESLANNTALSELPVTASSSFYSSSAASTSLSPLLSFCHLSILIADVLARDGRIKLSALISTSFHHLKCHCLINWLEDETRRRGERRAACLFLKILPLASARLPRVLPDIFLRRTASHVLWWAIKL